MLMNNQQINARKRHSADSLQASRQFKARVLGMLWVLCGALAHGQSRADYCGIRPAGFDQPARTLSANRYLNPAYGYSITIPKGLAAFVQARGPQRGLLIDLSVMPPAALRADAYYDAFYDISAAGVHQRDLNTIRLHDVVLSDDGVDVLLARNPGRRYLMRLRCGGAASVIVHEEIIVVRNREIYRLDLQSTPERYPDDVRYLNAMLRSWRWETVR
jgi:hypothetical protein